MSADLTGFRFGTKENTWRGQGEWVFVKGTTKAYEDLRQNGEALERIDNKLQMAEQRLMLALDRLRFLRAMIIGGHVRRDKYSAAMIETSQTPQDALKTIMVGVPESATPP